MRWPRVISGSGAGLVAKRDEGVVEFPGFKGLRNTVAPDELEVGDLTAAPNIDVDDAGSVARRKGNSAPVISGARHSLFASGRQCVIISGSTLNLVKSDYTEVALRTDMAANRPASYAPLANRIYFTNGAQMGVVENSTHRTFGLAVPTLPIATAFPGALPAGRYQFVMTYVRNDGQESGAGPAGAIDVAANGGINFTSLPVPTDPTVTKKWLYLTEANGEGFTRYSELPASATSTLAVDTKPLGAELRTQFLGPPPVGDIVAQFGAHLLVARGNMLYPSEPYAPELFDLRKGKPLQGRVVIVACMTDGVHCGTDEIHVWLGGKVPSEWAYAKTADYGAIPGSLAFASKSQVGKGHGAGFLAFWMSTAGVCMGDEGGGFQNLTEARFAYPVGDRGAGLVRRHNGMNQYIGVMHGVTAAGNSFN